MEWLKNLPVAGPRAERLMRTHAWRAYERLDSVHWERLAAAITFTSFVALFPALTAGAATGAALLGPPGVRRLKEQLAEQVPGFSDQLDLDDLLAHAGTVGFIAVGLLLFTGVGWVGTLRECLRAVWEKEEDPGNPVLLKVKDAGVLLGLGAVGLVAMGGSAFATSAVGWVADLLGLPEDGFGRVLLYVAGLAIGVVADFVLLVYLLTRLPRVQPDRRAVVVAGLIGAVGFELLKLLLSGYLQGVATKSMYGAFGVPVALLLWINFMGRLLLYCAAWTATQRVDVRSEDVRAGDVRAGDADDADTAVRTSSGPDTAPAPPPRDISRSAGAAPVPAAATDGAPAPRPHPAPPARRR